MVAGRKGMRLEAFKFGVYIGIPVVASGLFNDPETIRWFVDYFKFVTYPAPASSNPEFRKQLEDQTRQRKLIREQKEQYAEQLRKLDEVASSRDIQLDGKIDEKPWWQANWLFGLNQ